MVPTASVIRVFEEESECGEYPVPLGVPPIRIWLGVTLPPRPVRLLTLDEGESTMGLMRQ